MDNNIRAQALHDWADTLDDKTAQEFVTRGPDALNDDQLQTYYHARWGSVKDNNSDYWKRISGQSEDPTAPIEGVDITQTEKGIEALSKGMGYPAMAELGVGAIKGVPKLITALKGVKSSAPSAEEATKLATQAGQMMADRASKVEDLVGGFKNDMENGSTIQKAIGDASEVARKKAGSIFEGLKEAGQDVQAQTTNLKTAAENLGNELPGQLKSLLSQKQSSLSDLMNLRSRLTKFAASQTKVEGLAGQTSNFGRIAHDLVGELDKDISSTLDAASEAGSGPFSGDVMKTAYSNARDAWREFKDTYSNPAIKRIMSANPSEAAQIAFSSPENLNAVRAAGGDVATAAVKNSTVQQIMTKLGSTPKPQQILEKAVAAKPDEFGMLFSPKELSHLRDYTGARQFASGLNAGGDIAQGSNPVMSSIDFIFKKIPAPYRLAAETALAAYGYKKITKGQ